MEKTKKTKIYLATIYSIIILLFLLVFFSNFSLDELTTYDFLKKNREYLIQLKNTNIFFTSILFLFFTIFWVSILLGFGVPIALLSGFIFGKWIGTFIAILGLSLGATLLYILANYFLKEFIKDKFSYKFNFLYTKFKKNEFIFFLFYRFIGGIPFAISNVLPCLFEIKIKNFFFGTIIGMLPQIFVFVSLGSGIEKIIYKNKEFPSVSELFFSPEIYIPILIFFVLLIISFLFKKLFYKN